MTEFFLGGASSGKTTEIIKRIANDLLEGRKVILLVPEQSALIFEDRLCTYLQKNRIPQINLEVLNFTRLCNRIFRTYGGISYISVTRGAKSLIMWDALFLAAPHLKFYMKEIEDADKFVPSLINLIEDLKVNGITPEDLSNASSEAINDNDETLSNKLSDLSLIFSAYSTLIDKSFTDPSDDISKVNEILKMNTFFSGYNVYIDSFSSFSGVQKNILRSIIKQADSTVISFTVDDDNSYCFENVNSTIKDIKKLCNGKYTTTTFTAKNYRKNELEFLTDNIFSNTNKAVFENKTDRINISVCQNYFSEAEYVASDIIKKIRSGARYRDFAVIARNIDAYKGIIDAVFKKHGLPCRIFDKIELKEKPLFKLIRSAFNIKIHSWQLDDIMVYLKTGLSTVTEQEEYLLQNYVYTWNITGSQWYNDDGWYMNPDGYTDILTESGKKTLIEVNNIRKKMVLPLRKLHESLSSEFTVKDICTAIYTYLSELEIQDKISGMSDDDVRIWNAFCDTLDTMVEVIGSKKISAKLFIGLFTIVSEHSSIGALPSLIDEISIGSADRIRVDGIKHTYIIGVNEGVFPSAVPQHPFFSENEKAYLETCDIKVAQNVSSQLNDELYHFYTSASTPTESLNISCVKNDLSGEKMRPSIAFDRIKHLFPLNDVIDTENEVFENTVWDKAGAFEALSVTKNGDIKTALFNILSKDESFGSLITQKREPLIVGEEKLDEKTANELFPSDMVISQSKLDTFVLCNFNYHCRYTLGLTEQIQAKFSPRDTGNLIHRVLEKFFMKFDSEKGLPDLTDEELSKMIEDILNDYLSSIFGNITLAGISSRAMQLFMRLSRTLKLLIKNIINEFKQSEFIPRFFELEISNSGKENSVSSLRIPLPDGNSVMLRGFVDRVDICKKGKDVYVRVVDYKTGKKVFSLSDVAMGINLQMLLYLFSIWKDESGSFKRLVNCEGDIIPAGVLYFEARTPSIAIEKNMSAEDIYSLAEKSLKRNGLLINDEEILRLMEKKLENKYIPVSLKKDGTFTSASVNSLHSLEEMGALLNQITATVSKLASEIKSGKADCFPIKDSTHDGCKYCAHRYVCRRPESFVRKEY